MEKDHWLRYLPLGSKIPEMGTGMRRALGNFVICVASIGLSLMTATPAAHAQAFDGAWTGTFNCPAQGIKPAFSNPVRATISQNQFRLVRNTETYYEFTQGTVQADGSVSIAGQGQRRGSWITWATQFSGRTSAASMTLTGRMDQRSPCTIQLANTQPAPYSQAGAEIARQSKIAQAESEKRVEAERQRATEAAKDAALAREQKAIETQKAEAARQQINSVKVASAPTPAKEAALREAEEVKQRSLREIEAAKKQKETADAVLRDAAARSYEARALADLDQLPQTESREDWQPWVTKFSIQEIQFCKVMSKFYKDMKQAEIARNDIKKNLLKKQNQEDLASLIPDGVFDTWVVHAVEVRQAEDGSAAVILQAPCGVLIGSYLGTDCKDPAKFEGTIPENSPLYREFAKFDHNDFVLVSGRLGAVREPTPGPLPSYRSFSPGTYCTRPESGKYQELFVVQLKSIFKLVPPTNN